MNPIVERLVWFVLGVLVGAISVWLFSGSRRVKARVIATSIEPANTVVEFASPSGAVQPIDTLPPPPETLASSRVIDVGAARAAGFNLKHADDLTVIDGIGPKIEDQLRVNGIDSFVKVACHSVDDLRDILDRGGPSFRFANPESWPQQASLATQNRWKDLKKLQSERLARDDAPESQ